MKRPRILMLTGSYYPEVTGGGLQCRTLVKALGDQVQATVLTLSTDSHLPGFAEVDHVPVYRIFIDLRRRGSLLSAAIELTRIFVRLKNEFDIVHLHGFSRKSWLVIGLSRIFGKKILLKLTSVGEDDPPAVRKQGRIPFWFYKRIDFFIGVSPAQEKLYLEEGFPPERFRLIPNGVDLKRFHPVGVEERNRLRQELGLPENLSLILFVGFFSPNKGSELPFESWSGLHGNGLPPTGLLMIGASQLRYHEIDPHLKDRLQETAQRLGLSEKLFFIEKTHQIEKYYQAVDLFVFPSMREGLPNALMEAMAAGLPCIATHLPGVTDALLEEGKSGLLVPQGDSAPLQKSLRRLLLNRSEALEFGRKARETIDRSFTIQKIADRYLKIYEGI